MQRKSLNSVKMISVSAIVLFMCAASLVGAQGTEALIPDEPAANPTEAVTPETDVTRTAETNEVTETIATIATIATTENEPVAMSVNMDCILGCFEKRGHCFIHCNSDLPCMEACTEAYQTCVYLCGQ